MAICGLYVSAIPRSAASCDSEPVIVSYTLLVDTELQRIKGLSILVPPKSLR